MENQRFIIVFWESLQGPPHEPGAGEFSEDLITGFDHLIVIDFQIDRAGACKTWHSQYT
jgi:hypothetical protein